MDKETIVHITSAAPATKKNSQTIVTKGKIRLIQSKAYRRWVKEAKLIWIKPNHTRKQKAIDYPVNGKFIVYRERNVGDPINFWQAICDYLEKFGVVENDKWIYSLDGSRCLKDRDNPRVEVVLSPFVL